MGNGRGSCGVSTGLGPTVDSGQERERIVNYTNGAGALRTTEVLAIPPTYGSSSLSVVDWNNEGLVDLRNTNGVNADQR